MNHPEKESRRKGEGRAPRGWRRAAGPRSRLESQGASEPRKEEEGQLRVGKRRKRRPGKGREGSGGEEERRRRKKGASGAGREAPGAGRPRALGRAFGAGAERGGAAGTQASAGLSGVGHRILRAAGLCSEGHVHAALAARPRLLAFPGLPARAAPHLAAAPGRLGL